MSALSELLGKCCSGFMHLFLSQACTKIDRDSDAPEEYLFVSSYPGHAIYLYVVCKDDCELSAEKKYTVMLMNAGEGNGFHFNKFSDEGLKKGANRELVGGKRTNRELVYQFPVRPFLKNCTKDRETNILSAKDKMATGNTLQSVTSTPQVNPRMVLKRRAPRWSNAGG